MPKGETNPLDLLSYFTSMGFAQPIVAPYFANLLARTLNSLLVSLVPYNNRHQTDTKNIFDHFLLVPTSLKLHKCQAHSGRIPANIVFIPSSVRDSLVLIARFRAQR